MPTIHVSDGVELYFKDWGTGSALVFCHGWPLSSDAWDAQMLFFLSKGYRVIAHDRRSHGRSTQVAVNNNMNAYADDLAALLDHLQLQDVVLIGHSTGGGEVTRYIGRHGSSRLSKTVLMGAVPPVMLQSDMNPAGAPRSVFDEIRRQIVADRSQYFRDLTIPASLRQPYQGTSEPAWINLPVGPSSPRRANSTLVFAPSATLS